jgi:hypothetical protein
VSARSSKACTTITHKWIIQTELMIHREQEPSGCLGASLPVKIVPNRVPPKGIGDVKITWTYKHRAMTALL